MGFGSMMWKRTGRDYLYRAKTEDEVSFVVDSVLLPDEQQMDYYFVDCPYHVVAVVALDKNSEVVLIRQHRYVVDEVLIEVPCGSPQAGETLADGARRELAEEAGVQAARLEEIGTFYTSPGLTNQEVTVFLATELTVTEQNLDTTEDISVEWVPLKQAIEFVKKGSVSSQTSAIAVLMASLHA